MAPTIYTSEVVSASGTHMQRAQNNILNELTAQSRYITEEEANNRSRWFRLNLSGPLKSVPSSLCNLTYITTLVLRNNYLERLPPELGNLVNLINLDASCNRLRALPSTIGQLVDLRSLILNDNFLDHLPAEFCFLVNLRYLNLNHNPLNPQLSALYGDGSDVRGLVRFYVDNYFQTNMAPPPPPRQWRTFGNPSKNGYRFTLMTYNILSPNYATPHQYPYCPSWALEWEYRRRSLLEELRRYNATVICLQEIDHDQFEGFFAKELKKESYEGVFLPKSRQRHSDALMRKRTDGCAIFWNTTKLNKVAFFKHEFMMTCSNLGFTPNTALINRIMTRDNVAIGIVFEVKNANGANGRRFCVTTGHIHWDPEQPDVKLVQSIFWTAELWNKLEEFTAANAGSGGASKMPVILCGDFNSLPQSGVVEFLSTGCVLKNHLDFQVIGKDVDYEFGKWNLLNEARFDGEKVRHLFNFERAYRGNAQDGMRITNMTYDFKGIIDYIFFTKNHFRLLGSLDQIPDSWFIDERILGCPHIHLPSDHFSLLVEFDLLANPTRGGAGGLAISEPVTSTTPTTSATATTSASNQPVGGNSPKSKGGNTKQGKQGSGKR